MKKRGDLINRGIAAAITLVFLMAVRPDPEPTALEWGIVTLLMYEGLRYCIGYVRKETRRKKVKENTDAMRYDGARWAAERMDWPLYEVRVKEVG